LIVHTSTGANVKWIEYGRMWGDSVYASLVTSGLPASAANIGQAVAIATAASATYRAYRLPLPVNHKTAVLLSATILAAPHSTLADAVLLALAAALWIGEPIGTSEPTCKWPLILCLWLVPLFNPPEISAAGRLTPIVVTAITVMIIGGSKPPQAPVIHTAAIS
jgi:alpha-1,2-mannosyltransferase